jgi:hypothetical protein
MCTHGSSCVALVMRQRHHRPQIKIVVRDRLTHTLTRSRTRHTRTHAHTHTLTHSLTHTHARTHLRVHAHAHTHTHTHLGPFFFWVTQGCSSKDDVAQTQHNSACATEPSHPATFTLAHAHVCIQTRSWHVHHAYLQTCTSTHTSHPRQTNAQTHNRTHLVWVGKHVLANRKRRDAFLHLSLRQHACVCVSVSVSVCVY